MSILQLLVMPGQVDTGSFAMSWCVGSFAGFLNESGDVRFLDPVLLIN
jgi:hypothetical protein